MVERFGGICLLSGNVPRLCSFYEAVLQRPADESSESFADFRLGDISLAIFSLEGMESMAAGSLEASGTGRFTLDLEVPDVDQEFARLQAMNVPIVKCPASYPWGRRSFWFRDPDGNIVNFFTDLT